ncbi:hypothetical protein [Microbispora bryophytorum]|uniref:hypothetical protein n=1 Tax=Microbispora bryophytorum TaxID=1460882 RepID=UPI0033EFFAFA
MRCELACAWADSAYTGSLVSWAHRFLNLTVTVVARPAGAVGVIKVIAAVFRRGRSARCR